MIPTLASKSKDVHVPAAITRGLILRGVDVITAQLDGTARLEDPKLLDRATQPGRVRDLAIAGEPHLAVAAAADAAEQFVVGDGGG